MNGLIIANINLINGIIAVICALLQLVRKGKSAVSYNITVLYLLMAYLLFYFWSFESGTIYKYPFMIYSDVAVTFAVGPAFYLYLKRLAGKGGRFFISSYRHFIPFFAALCIIGTFHASGDYLLSYYLVHRPAYPDYGENALINIVNTLADISVFVYLILSIIKVKSLIKPDMSGPVTALRNVLYFFIAVTVSTSLIFYAHYINNNALIAFASTAIGTLVVYYFIFSYRHPEITQAVLAEDRSSLLASVDAAGITGRITEMMEKERIYKEDITLQSLSRVLGVNNHTLTVILNDKMRMNFRTLINYYRIKEARSLLETEPGMSVLEIAFNVGFKSKTTFNTAFLKETGLSPVQYRERHQKKIS